MFGLKMEPMVEPTFEDELPYQKQITKLDYQIWVSYIHGTSLFLEPTFNKINVKNKFIKSSQQIPFKNCDFSLIQQNCMELISKYIYIIKNFIYWIMFMNDAQSMGTLDSSNIISKEYYEVPYSEEHFEKNQLSGAYKRYNSITNDLQIQGEFLYGQRVGKWIQYNDEGDKAIYKYQSYRSGALCNDGSFSSATGRGACSWHGGVAEWIYKTKKIFVGGTGIFEPIDSRHPKKREEAMKVYGIKKSNNPLEDQWLLYKESIKKFKATLQAKDIIEELQRNNEILSKKVLQKEDTIKQLMSRLLQIKNISSMNHEEEVRINEKEKQLSAESDEQAEIKKETKALELNLQKLKLQDNQLKQLDNLNHQPLQKAQEKLITVENSNKEVQDKIQYPIIKQEKQQKIDEKQIEAKELNQEQYKKEQRKQQQQKVQELKKQEEQKEQEDLIKNKLLPQVAGLSSNQGQFNLDRSSDEKNQKSENSEENNDNGADLNESDDYKYDEQKMEDLLNILKNRIENNNDQ